jgi:hypothetical protein
MSTFGQLKYNTGFSDGIDTSGPVATFEGAAEAYINHPTLGSE